MQFETKDLFTFDGKKLRLVIRENGSKDWLIVTHGLGEHCDRHQYIFKLFGQAFNILLYDLRGHGQSEGERGFVEHFSDFHQDLDFIIQYLQKDFNLQRYSLFGHSMGGLITAGYLQRLHERDFIYPTKVFLSSPAVQAPGAMGHLFTYTPMGVMSFLAKLPKSVPLQGVLDLKYLSHDSRIYQAYVEDKLNILAIHSKLFFELLNEQKIVFEKPLRAKCPLFVSIGTEDKLVHPKYLIDYFTQIEKSAHLKIFEGAYHEIHNEIERYSAPYFEFLKTSLL